MHIFLDIDGVLNCKSDWRNPYTINPKCLDTFVKLIKQLEDVKIILTSTWRVGFSLTGNHSGQIKSLMSNLAANGITISGYTPVTDKGRQAEIEYYIRRNNVREYIVLDDDETLFSNPEKINLYLTDYRTGLQDKDIKIIIKQIKRYDKEH